MEKPLAAVEVAVSELMVTVPDMSKKSSSLSVAPLMVAPERERLLLSLAEKPRRELPEMVRLRMSTLLEPLVTATPPIDPLLVMLIVSMRNRYRRMNFGYGSEKQIDYAALMSRQERKIPDRELREAIKGKVVIITWSVQGVVTMWT